MTLPILQLPIHSIELPVSKKVVQFNPFVIKEEKSFLTSINTEDQKDVINLFHVLVKNCVIGDLDVKMLNVVDFFYLIIHIRMKSTSEMLEGKLDCPKCKKTTEFEVNLEESLIVRNPDVSVFTCKVNDKLTLELTPPRIEAFTLQEKASIVDIIAHSIKTVVYEGKVYDNFEIEELHRNILDNLVKKEYDSIAEGMSKLAKLSTKFKYACMNCSKTSEYETDNIVNFF
jgi:hypothetical protein